MKKIQFTKGCPNNCEYCYEPKEMEYLNVAFPDGEDCVQIQDMNFLANPDHIGILKTLKGLNKSYEFTCGIDFRILTQEICDLMKAAKFIKVRWAWDYRFTQQKTHKKVWQMFLKAGYKSEDLSVFILVNWKIDYWNCLKKLDLLKVWNVKVNDCCFDGGYKKAKPYHWDIDHIKDFRHRCRKHNQMVLFKIDPQLK